MFIRFVDDWWTWFIGSQLLYSLKDNWITLCCNWLLCYGMHRGKLSNLPGAWLPPLNWYQISYYSDEKFDGFVILTGNDFLFSLRLIVLRLKSITMRPLLKSRWWIQCDMTKQSCTLAQETKSERFPNIMINNSFQKLNYSSMCSFLVNWILEEDHSQSCYIFGSRAIRIPEWLWYLLHLDHLDITVWMLLVTAAL